MPIDAEYTWNQTEESIEIQISLKGTPARQVDVYISDVLVKINFAPYLLQLDLCKPVLFDKSVARFDQRDGKLHLIFPKAESANAPWKSLVHMYPATASPSEKRLLRQERRAASMERKEKYDAEIAELVKEKRFKNEKLTLRRQMAVEEDERQHIEELKAEEKEEAERAVYEQFSKLQHEEEMQAQLKKKNTATTESNTPASTSSATSSAAPLATMLPVSCAAAVATNTVAPSSITNITASAESSSSTTATAPVDLSSNSAIWSDDEEEQEKEEEEEEEEEDNNKESAENTTQKTVVLINNVPTAHDEEDMDFVPDPRVTSTIKLGFTERFFPTPARESKLAEESDWLAKNGAHVGKRWGQKRASGGNDQSSDARDISERDPMWLKGKGDDFYRSRDFQSAANAYTAALAVDPNEPVLAALSNRAACYLRLGSYERCREDCTRVVELLPPVPKAAAAGQLFPRELKKAQLGTRSRILVRRGAASCELGDYSSAVVDYEESISILLLDQEAVTGGPSGTQLTPEALDQAKAQIHALHSDLSRIRTLAECSNLKDAGDAALRRKDPAQAVDSYTKAIELDGSFVSALSNRAAAYLATSEWQLAAEDCTKALTYLRDSGAGGGGAVGESGPPLGAVPRGGSARHASFAAKTYARRATAMWKRGNYATAADDLQAALVLDAGNAKLMADLERVQQLLLSTEEAASTGFVKEEQELRKEEVAEE